MPAPAFGCLAPAAVPADQRLFVRRHVQAHWSMDTNLTVLSAWVHGLDVASSWQSSPVPGTYWLTYVVPGQAPLLVGKSPNMQLQLVDPRCVLILLARSHRRQDRGVRWPVPDLCVPHVCFVRVERNR
jgi:hypothetical protein